MDYANFDLRLREWDPQSHTGEAEVSTSPLGEGKSYSFHLDFDIEEFVKRSYSDRTMAVKVGQKLAGSILFQDSLDQWYESYARETARERGLRLRLYINSWELARLPWELLYDKRQGCFLVFDPYVSLVRYVSLRVAPPELRQSKSLRILAVSASPIDQAELQWESELRVLREALAELHKEGLVEVIACEHATHERLLEGLSDNTPDVVHFIGHAAYDEHEHRGFLLLEDKDRRSAELGASDAAILLRRYNTNLVVLNACETASGAWAGLAPALVRARIPAVVAMQWPVRDWAAIRFSKYFYRALSRGKTIDECVAEGRVGAHVTVSPNPNDWAAPVLFLRSNVGQLWAREVPALEKGSRAVPTPQAPETRGGPKAPVQPEGEFHFRTRGPVLTAADAGLVVDRPELRRAIRIAQQPSVTQYIAFLGAKHTGKTTLLFRLIEMLQESYACIFIDLSVLRAQSIEACFRFVAFRLISEFRAMLGPSYPLPETRKIESSIEFLEFLRELSYVPVPRIIIMMDRVGALSPEVSEAFFSTLRTVFSQGRRLNDNLSKYLFIFSGAVDLYTLTSGSNSPLNICEKLYLRDFELPEVEQIVGNFRRLGIDVAEGVPAEIFELTGGHPYLVQRICAAMERNHPKAITPAEVKAAAEEILIEDENIHHIIHELRSHPKESRRLRKILEGSKVPFSRNDPILASLEMMGVIRPTQPCQIRNKLYERALRRFYAQLDEESMPAPLPEPKSLEDVQAMYEHLQSLRAEALDVNGAYKPGRVWETFAAALFSMVPAFSVYPDVRAGKEQLDIVLAINSDAQGGSYWNTYQPAILVETKNLSETTPENIISEVLGKASLHNIKLVFVMTSGVGTGAAKEQESYSGTREDTCIVLVDDAEIAALLEERGGLDKFLRSKVLEARLHKI